MVTSVSETGGVSQAPHAGSEEYLDGFLAKSLSGDALFSIMALECRNNAISGESERQLLGIRRHETRLAHQRKLEALRKYWAAFQKAKKWGLFGKIVAAVLAVAAVGVAVACGPAVGSLVAMGAGLAKGIGKVGKSIYDMKAGYAQADQMLADSVKEQSKQMQAQLLGDMRQAMECEQKMLRTLGKMVEHEYALRVR